MTAEPGPGQTLFQFVRHWSRRWNGDDEVSEQGRLVLVTEAVRAVSAREAATINAIAREIAIDQSGASRLVKSAVAAGYLELTTSPTDARRREVAVTTAGDRMLKDAHRWQEKVFDDLTAHWSPRQRDDFQRSMLDLVERSHARMDS
ncbi:MarR family transcriptional regulator [Kribbella sp. ALI-6-A]|uniref:MarR family winged helix-turn-helix transcriptional regulator n=1 Tax=Kribbella sp. ALI-6-A TaxID=1933817 RepID=UPI00097BC10B|nr:MarR family winged helix-turn-helix transcriptional regulator [Kribbella sp. ALI-6-A]ONI76653.1 MarR family transcriptional regulator [Kribbella sp. ALI-6-A]